MVILLRRASLWGVWRKVSSPEVPQAIFLRTSYELCLRMVQFLLFAVDGSGSIHVMGLSSSSWLW